MTDEKCLKIFKHNNNVGGPWFWDLRDITFDNKRCSRWNYNENREKRPSNNIVVLRRSTSLFIMTCVFQRHGDVGCIFFSKQFLDGISIVFHSGVLGMHNNAERRDTTIIVIRMPTTHLGERNEKRKLPRTARTRPGQRRRSILQDPAGRAGRTCCREGGGRYPNNRRRPHPTCTRGSWRTENDVSPGRKRRKIIKNL